MLVIRACVRTWASAAARASGGAESRSTGEIRGMLALREKVRRSTQCREFPAEGEEEESLRARVGMRRVASGTNDREAWSGLHRLRPRRRRSSAAYDCSPRI